MSNQSQPSAKRSEAKKAYQRPTIERVNLQVREIMLGACWSATAPADTQVGGCQISGCSG
jgi:hypothetical protein